MSVEPDTPSTDTDDPHSHVAAVYDTETAAREHKRDLANNAFQHGAVAWGVHEQAVETAFGEVGDA